MHRAACRQRGKRHLAHSNHVIVLSLASLVEGDTSNRGIVIEEDDLEALALEVVIRLGINQHLIRVSIVELRVESDLVGRVAIVECVELVEEEGRDIGNVSIARLEALGTHD